MATPTTTPAITPTTTGPARPVDDELLQAFLHRFVGDLGATVQAANVVIGDKLGLYAAMADGTPVTPAELAHRTSTHERYVTEWLAGQAAGGYVTYGDGLYSLSPEQAFALADEASPAFVPGAFQLACASVRDEPRIAEAFRSGEGVGWHEHNDDVFAGCERFFRPGYAANLVSAWIPALDGVRAKLERGATVADVGCGLGPSTVLMAQAFPASTFTGFDYHTGSIEQARTQASAAGLGERCRFEVASASAYPARSYDLVTTFDALHDMGDPAGAARHVLETLAPDGTWLLVEPAAGDTVEDNLNPVGRAYYGFSTLLCVPNAIAQGGAMTLGAQAGEARLREVVTGAGFTRFAVVARTPFNIVIEARP